MPESYFNLQNPTQAAVGRFELEGRFWKRGRTFAKVCKEALECSPGLRACWSTWTHKCRERQHMIFRSTRCFRTCSFCRWVTGGCKKKGSRELRSPCSRNPHVLTFSPGPVLLDFSLLIFLSFYFIYLFLVPIASFSTTLLSWTISFLCLHLLGDLTFPLKHISPKLVA